MTARFEDSNTIRCLQSLNLLVQSVCSIKTLKRRVPIVEWLPKYTFARFIQDLIAGITVGLTAIPQGMAYATVAGLPPEYGLYSGMLGGFIYVFFGTCKEASIGPTAIMSALVAKCMYGYNKDFAILAAFLAGIIELTMGIFHLGFLVQYISKPVISGFSNAAALQIITSQLQPLFGHPGHAGHIFAESVTSFVKHIQSLQILDTALGFTTLIILFLMQYLGNGCQSSKSMAKKFRWYFSLSRNALVVIIGILVTVCLKAGGFGEPITVIGDIVSGLPKFQTPPLSTTLGNETYNFVDMVNALGTGAISIPIVGIMEIVAVSSAFSATGAINASQEMMALGICTIFSSFIGSMPITTSFSRAGLNRASGAQTPAGGVFTGCLIILALSLLTSIFYFIPKSTLAAMIIVAMSSMTNFQIFGKLWKDSKCELFVMMITMVTALYFGLEYGIMCGVLIQALILLYGSSKPGIEVTYVRSDKEDVVLVQLSSDLTYCSIDHVRRTIFKASDLGNDNSTLIIDGTFLIKIDFTITSILMTMYKALEQKHKQIVFLNFSPSPKNMCLNIRPDLEEIFIEVSNVGDYVNWFSSSRNFKFSITYL